MLMKVPGVDRFQPPYISNHCGNHSARWETRGYYSWQYQRSALGSFGGSMKYTHSRTHDFIFMYIRFDFPWKSWGPILVLFRKKNLYRLVQLTNSIFTLHIKISIFTELIINFGARILQYNCASNICLHQWCWQLSFLHIASVVPGMQTV